jgi:hypothetical protein
LDFLRSTKKKKRLAYEELQNLSLFDKNAVNLKCNLEIKYDGNEVKNLFLLTVLIKNTGNVPIAKEDVHVPINLKFNHNFIECTVIKESIKGLNIKLTPSTNKDYVIIEFNLLNPGDYFVLQFVSLNQLSDHEIDFRIADLSVISYGSLMKGVFDREKLWNLINKSPAYKLLLSIVVVVVFSSMYYIITQN